MAKHENWKASSLVHLARYLYDSHMVVNDRWVCDNFRPYRRMEDNCSRDYGMHRSRIRHTTAIWCHFPVIPIKVFNMKCQNNFSFFATVQVQMQLLDRFLIGFTKLLEP